MLGEAFKYLETLKKTLNTIVLETAQFLLTCCKYLVSLDISQIKIHLHSRNYDY